MRNRNSPFAVRKDSRRGLTALLAMLYLALIASLAVGFYASSNTAAMVTENEKRIGMALVACESGMDFMRYHMDQVTIPYGTTQAQLFTKLYNDLKVQLENTGNFGTKSIANDGAFIYVPANASEYIKLDSSGAEFRATVENLGQKVQIKIVGRYNGYEAKRAVQMKFDLAERASQIFNYGVASKGAVTTGGSAIIKGLNDPTKGSILSTSSDANPVNIQGPSVSGDISVVGNGNVTFGGSTSIGGTTDDAEIIANHIHKNVIAPEFPTIDVNNIKAFATNVYTGGNVLNNAIIPPNTNPNFTGDATITGVLLVMPPNVVTFRGNTTIKGVIVAPNAADSTGNLSTNIIDFRGSVMATGVETLPDSYGDLKKLTGAFLEAPNFQAKFSGNFGNIYGSIVTDKITMSGGATGTIFGSLVTLKDTAMSLNGSSSITIASTGTMNYPAGVYFSSRYAALADTYEEVKP